MNELTWWLSVWLVVAVYLLARHWRTGQSTGLLFAYVLNFGILYWFAAATYQLPWYTPVTIEPTTTGLRLAVIGFVALAGGAELGAVLHRRWRRPTTAAVAASTADPRLVATFLAAGLLAYTVVAPILATLPTASALASTASSLVVVAVGLLAWNAWQQQHRVRYWAALALSLVFPLATLLVEGFLGFGFGAMVVVAAFGASVYRPRWHVIAVGMIVAYAGLSVYVTYMRDRRDIRAVVWGGQDIASRVNRLSETFTQTEWFDLNDIDHLRRIDDRLNQSVFVGVAADRMASGATTYARGETLSSAAMALVPRVLWPSKPVVAGSGDLVTVFTGIEFAQGTSVGIGHVMEWFVNFGLAGIVFGFAAFGVVIVYVDRSAAAHLHDGDIGRFALWFMPGLSVLNIGGSFVEMTSSAAASAVVVRSLLWAMAHYAPHIGASRAADERVETL